MLKAKRTRLSEPMRVSRRIALSEVSPKSSELATSPAILPTPTTDIGPSGSRSWLPKAASATPTSFCGMRTSSP